MIKEDGMAVKKSVLNLEFLPVVSASCWMLSRSYSDSLGVRTSIRLATYYLGYFSTP